MSIKERIKLGFFALCALAMLYITLVVGFFIIHAAVVTVRVLSNGGILGC